MSQNSNEVERDHTERNHQGFDNKIITPDFGEFLEIGRVRCRSRLRGMFRRYYRDAARIPPRSSFGTQPGAPFTESVPQGSASGLRLAVGNENSIAFMTR